MCKGVLRLTKRIPSSQAPHGAKTLTLSRSHYAIPSGEGLRVPLHLARKAMKLLSRRRLVVQAMAVAHGRVEAVQSVLACSTVSYVAWTGVRSTHPGLVPMAAR